MFKIFNKRLRTFTSIIDHAEEDAKKGKSVLEVNGEETLELLKKVETVIEKLSGFGRRSYTIQELEEFNPILAHEIKLEIIKDMAFELFKERANEIIKARFIRMEKNKEGNLYVYVNLIAMRALNEGDRVGNAFGTGEYISDTSQHIKELNYVYPHGETTFLITIPVFIGIAKMEETKIIPNF